MSNIRSLVPPWELCKQLPVGLFKSTIFVWRHDVYDGEDDPVLICRVFEEPSGELAADECAAPTLHEMMNKLYELSANHENPKLHDSTIGLLWERIPCAFSQNHVIGSVLTQEDATAEIAMCKLLLRMCKIKQLIKEDK